MFLDNKYTKLYYILVNKSIERNHIKQKHDKYHRHHIIPRCLGGSDDSNNLVTLTFKEHRVCHRLLVKMVEGDARRKMKSALVLFTHEKSADVIAYANSFRTEETYKKAVQTRKRRGSYKTGSENTFASDELRDLVSKRMTDKNPMKDPTQRERMRLKNNNPKTRPILVFPDKKWFPSMNAAIRHYNTTRPLFIRNYMFEKLEVS